jgi:DNA-binding transcriptional MerR regulator
MPRKARHAHRGKDMKRRPANRKSNAPPPGLKMNELAAATGVPKSTILFYLGQGLLPQPRKTSLNMAYYEPACVERIRLIQQMQERHRLTLSEIRHCLDDTDRGSEFGVYLDLNEEVFDPGGPSLRRLLDAKAFCEETGLNAGQLEELQQARLLLPLAEGRFDAQDVSMGRMYLDAFNFGIRARDLSYYADIGEKIVDQEMDLRNQMIGRPPHPPDAAATAKLAKNVRMCRAYVIDRLFQHRVAAMHDLKNQPAPVREEREPWLD